MHPNKSSELKKKERSAEKESDEGLNQLTLTENDEEDEREAITNCPASCGKKGPRTFTAISKQNISENLLGLISNRIKIL